MLEFFSWVEHWLDLGQVPGKGYQVGSVVWEGVHRAKSVVQTGKA